MSSQFGKNFGLEALELAKEAERKDIELWAITQRIQSAKLRRWVGRGGRWEVSLQDAIRLEEGSGKSGLGNTCGHHSFASSACRNASKLPSAAEQKKQEKAMCTILTLSENLSVDHAVKQRLRSHGLARFNNV